MTVIMILIIIIVEGDLMTMFEFFRLIKAGAEAPMDRWMGCLDSTLQKMNTCPQRPYPQEMEDHVPHALSYERPVQ